MLVLDGVLGNDGLEALEDEGFVMFVVRAVGHDRCFV